MPLSPCYSWYWGGGRSGLLLLDNGITFDAVTVNRESAALDKVSLSVADRGVKSGQVRLPHRQVRSRFSKLEQV